MKSGKLLILGMILIVPALNAQFKNFDLSKYELPYLKRHQLDLNFNFNNSELLNYNHTIDSTDEGRNFSVSGVFLPEYRFYRNTEKYQGSLLSVLQLYPSNSSRKNPVESIQKRSEITGIMGIQSLNRFYFEKKFFIETNVNLNNNFSNSRDITEYPNSKTEETYKSSSVYSGMEILIGKGRMEYVEDIRLALYILEDLQKSNRLARIPSDDEVIEFARLISALQNERFFDIRIKRIENLEKINEFLVTKNIIAGDDATTFAVIMDNWDYASEPLRGSGFRVSAGINPEVRLNRFRQETDNQENQEIYENQSATSEILSLVVFTYSKPINLYWQFDHEIRVEYGKSMKDKHPFESEFYQSNVFNGSVYSYLSYFPNSRSDYHVGMRGNYINYFSNKNENLGAYILFNGNYYISPRLRLKFNAQFSYHDTDQPGSDLVFYQNELNYNLSAGLTYKIF